MSRVLAFVVQVADGDLVRSVETVVNMIGERVAQDREGRFATIDCTAAGFDMTEHAVKALARGAEIGAGGRRGRVGLSAAPNERRVGDCPPLCSSVSRRRHVSKRLARRLPR